MIFVLQFCIFSNDSGFFSPSSPFLDCPCLQEDGKTLCDALPCLLFWSNRTNQPSASVATSCTLENRKFTCTNNAAALGGRRWTFDCSNSTATQNGTSLPSINKGSFSFRTKYSQRTINCTFDGATQMNGTYIKVSLWSFSFP